MEQYHRIFVIVLDSLGIGAMPDAARFGDVDVDTLLDAAWDAGCFADARLMEMLKQRKERP